MREDRDHGGALLDVAHDSASAATRTSEHILQEGANEPIEGIVDGVRLELEARASSSPAPALLARRLQVATLLLRRADERAPEPPPDEDEELAEERPEQGEKSE